MWTISFFSKSPFSSSAATYHPRKEVEIDAVLTATIIEPNAAICVRATDNFVDRNGIHRTCGEMWLVKEPGAYLLGVNEKLEDRRTAIVLTDQVSHIYTADNLKYLSNLVIYSGGR